jgi:hypothetical protein
MIITTTHTVNQRRVIAVGIVAAGVLLALGTASPAHAANPNPTPVNLGTADSYEVLAGSTITNTGSTVVNNGDVGLSPGSSVTGFPPGVINNGVIHATDAQAQQAQADLTTAYLDAAGRSSDGTIAGDALGGLTLVPGVYTGDALSLTGTLTLSGDASSVWIFQAASKLTTDSGSHVAFTAAGNGGTPGPCNVFWQVGSSATIGSGSTFAGTVMSLTSITVDAGATIDGRLLARNQAVTGITVTLNRPADCAARSAIVASTPTAEQIAAAKAAAARLADTGFDPIPGLVTASALLVFGGVLVGQSRFRRRAAGSRVRGIGKPARRH